MADIKNLVHDINDLLVNKLDATNKENVLIAATNIARATKRRLEREERKPRPDKTLYMSEIGKPCHRELWYRIHMPQAAMQLGPAAEMKFMYGDILESVALLLAKEAGHKVEREQELVENELGNGWKVRGRIDAVIDDTLCDVKTVTTQSKSKFQNLNDYNDAFGYRSQLASYATYTTGYSLTGHEGFFLIDKSLGGIDYVEMGMSVTLAHANDASKLPFRELETTGTFNPVAKLPVRKDGGLCVTCAYCGFRQECWPSAKYVPAKGPRGGGTWVP